MHKRIAITALVTLFASSSLLATLAKPASADADDHPQQPRYHHAYQNGSQPNGNGWYNGKYYGNNGNANNWRNNGNANNWRNNGNANNWRNGTNWNNGNHRDRDDRNRRRDRDHDHDHDRR